LVKAIVKLFRNCIFSIFAIGAFGFLLGKMRTFDVAAAFSINKFVMFVCMQALCIKF